MKQIKDLQTPIEVSTYDEIKKIMKSGKYHIKCEYHQMFYSTEEFISLECRSTCDRKTYTINDLKDLESRKTYTINDLKDLESRLVLIRDHASNDEVLNKSASDVQNADIEFFLNVS